MSKLPTSPDGLKLRPIKIESYQRNPKEGGKIRAFFKVRTSDGFLISGFKILDGRDGDQFVGYPADNVNGQWRATVFTSKEIKAKITELALAEAERYLVKQQQGTTKPPWEEQPDDDKPF